MEFRNKHHELCEYKVNIDSHFPLHKKCLKIQYFIFMHQKKKKKLVNQTKIYAT